MASNEYFYLDFPQIQGQRNWVWMKTTTLQKCYEQDPDVYKRQGYVSLKEISARQDITVRYLEQIIAIDVYKRQLL